MWLIENIQGFWFGLTQMRYVETLFEQSRHQSHLNRLREAYANIATRLQAR
jgi:uncharacterized protein YukE